MNLSDEHSLTELNDDKARMFIPVMSYLGVLMVFGTFGNVMVLYFYGCKTKPSPSVSFIFALAVFDLTVCLIGLPIEITDLRFYFNFKSEPACKVLRSVTHFASISSAITLTVIAVDRYRRICKPFARQLNSKHVKIICVATGILSLLLSWPAVVFNEVVTVDIVNANNQTVYGKDCTTTKRENLKPYMLAFNIIYGVAFFIVTVALIVLYAFISRQLFKHKKFRSYMASSIKVKRIDVKSRSSSEEQLLPPREYTTLSNKVFADPPDATGSTVDMRDFVTRGLTEVEPDRPSSGFTTTTGTTRLTGLTDLSGRTKRTLHSTKSVTICEPSKNQIFPIERREYKVRPNSGKTESTWMTIDDERPGSASSFATFSSRPSTAGLSTFTEVSVPRHVPIYNQKDIAVSEATAAAESQHEFDDDVEEQEEGRTNYKLFEHDIDGKTSVTIVEEMDSRQSTFVATDLQSQSAQGINMPIEDIANAEGFASNDSCNDKMIENCTEMSENHVGSAIFDKLNQDNERNASDTKSEKILNKQMEASDQKTEDIPRPKSGKSEKSHKTERSGTSRFSPRVRTKRHVSRATSVASRASTVKRIKRLLNKVSSKETMVADADDVKELRIKMLDINTVKYTVMMLAVTVLFVGSFLPYLALITWRYFKDEHEVKLMSDSELVWFHIGVRSIFLNSSLNPLVYGGFNSRFRAFFCACCCCFRCKKHIQRRKAGNVSRDQSSSVSVT